MTSDSITVEEVTQRLARAAFFVDSTHHIWKPDGGGDPRCTCGFVGDARKRTQTEHITTAVLEAFDHPYGPHDLAGYQDESRCRAIADAAIAALAHQAPATEPATVVVHHHDIESHAASFNEGYETARLHDVALRTANAHGDQAVRGTLDAATAALTLAERSGYSDPRLTEHLDRLDTMRTILNTDPEAPATEDEAAEVEWAIAYGDDPTDASTETHDRAEAEVRLERLRKKHADLILVTRAVTPWREVSS